MTFALEVDLIRLAHDLDLFTSPYVFDPAQARAMVDAGADQIVAHAGLTVSGSIGAGVALSLSEGIERVLKIAEAAEAETQTSCHLSRRALR